MDEKIMIRTEHLSKDYRLYDRRSDRLMELFPFFRKKSQKFHSALRDISLTVRQGETVGIIGVNGSGKSTLLKILTGVVQPTGGTAEVNGRVSALLELGAGFNPEYTGLENIYLNGTMMNISRAEMDALVPEIVEFADIGPFIHQPVKSYSSGMFARLAFAVAISVKPDVLIVDEALSVGDIYFQTKCYRKFDEFRAAGMTILFVSHDLNSISKYCSRAVLLDHGDLVAEGAPKEIVDRYKRILSGRTALRGEAPSGTEKAEPEEEEGGSWQAQMGRNPDTLEYGDGSAEIIDFGVFDEGDRLNGTVAKGSVCTIRMKIRFMRDLQEPIFAFCIKNRLGIELTGTNTWIEGVETGTCRAGETVTVAFRQPVMLQGGEYLLSLGCTGYGQDELLVYHRLYDVCGFLVVSGKDTVGYYDMGSTVAIEKKE